jgi:hypothetical protein
MAYECNDHYVCDLVDSDAVEDAAENELGLTLRARLTRSKGQYAMLEGSIFNPERLLEAVCNVAHYEKEEFIGGAYMKGYTLLTITADGCVNKYMVFNKNLLNSLIKKLDSVVVKK